LGSLGGDSTCQRIAKCPARPKHTGDTRRQRLQNVGLLPILWIFALLLPTTASAQHSIVQVAANPSMAFAHYVAWLHARDPFTESGPVALEIDASLPGVDKQEHLLAIRHIGESERSEYLLLQAGGDPIVWKRAIAPYLLLQRHSEDLPLSTVMITPLNYRFRYKGVVETKDNSAYVFQITPRKKREGLISGELWIEPRTGAPVLVSGRLVEPASARSISVMRETKIPGGCSWLRITHVTIEVRPAGRAELNIVELPLGMSDEQLARVLVAHLTVTAPLRESCVSGML
jgi:hypothetical protein